MSECNDCRCSSADLAKARGRCPMKVGTPGMDALFDGSDAHLLPSPRTSYLHCDELPAISLALHKRTPYAIQNVSAGQLSVARHAGMCKYNGDTFIYFAEFDELVRDDVLDFVHNRRRAAEALDRMAEDARQLGLEY